MQTLDNPLRALPQPEPSMGRKAYEDERQIRLATSPRCQENHQRFLAAKRGALVDYLPIKLDIENVSRCNFRCTMCQVSEWPKGRRAADMSLEAFQALIDEQYGLVEIKLQGMGEPTLGGETLFSMIRHARERNIWVRTVTNASLLHLKDNYARLIDSDPNELQISVDGATKEVFESIRQGSQFEMVADNCRRVNAYCREKGVVRTKMWVVVQAANMHQTEQLVRFGADLGFESMVFSLNLGNWGQESWDQRNRAVTMEDSFSVELAWRLVDLGKSLGIKVAFWSVASKYDSRDPAKLCPWPFERLYVSSDLRAVPCCMIANPEVLDLGGLPNGQGLAELWQGEGYRAFRKAHLDGDIPPACRSCYI